MKKFSGSFSGKVNWQNDVTLHHRGGHHLNFAEVSGEQDCSDVKWKGATLTYWIFSDIKGDESTFHAYYSNTDKEGDRDWGRIDGRTFKDNGEAKIEGKWILDGGDGKFKGIKGNGRVWGHVISPPEVKLDWDGEYEI